MTRSVKATKKIIEVGKKHVLDQTHGSSATKS
jgi:hypothetical protein